MIRLDIVNTSRSKINKSEIKMIAHKVLEDFHRDQEIVIINIVNDKTIKKINKSTLKHNYTTDVIAFSYNEYPLLTCEIYVCSDVAEREAKIRKLSFNNELCRYIIHGILHHIGYSDKANSDRSKMFKIQEEYLSYIP